MPKRPTTQQYIANYIYQNLKKSSQKQTQSDKLNRLVRTLRQRQQFINTYKKEDQTSKSKSPQFKKSKSKNNMREKSKSLTNINKNLQKKKQKSVKRIIVPAPQRQTPDRQIQVSTISQQKKGKNTKKIQMLVKQPPLRYIQIQANPSKSPQKTVHFYKPPPCQTSKSHPYNKYTTWKRPLNLLKSIQNTLQYTNSTQKLFNLYSPKGNQRKVITETKLLEAIGHPSKNITGHGYYPIGKEINPYGKYTDSTFRNCVAHTFGNQQKYTNHQIKSPRADQAPLISERKLFRSKSQLMKNAKSIYCEIKKVQKVNPDLNKTTSTHQSYKKPSFNSPLYNPEYRIQVGQFYKHLLHG